MANIDNGISDTTRAAYAYRDALREAASKAMTLAERQKEDYTCSPYDVYHSIKSHMALAAKEREVTRRYDISPV